MTPTRVAVIGVGHHGRHHARNLAALPDTRLVAVVDADQATASQIALRHGALALADPKDLLGKVDAVCVAVPTVAHYGVAHHFLRRGVATLIEKPLAFSVEEARELVRLSRRHHAVLAVGHIERHNPVWAAVEESGAAPEFIEARRQSRYPFRGLDVSVVFDVMIHDLEMVLAAIDAPVTSVAATGHAVVSQTHDQVWVTLGFANGALARLLASRVHHESVRQMTLWDSKGHLEIDFQQRCATRSRAAASDPLHPRRYPAALAPEDKERLLRELFTVSTTTYDREVEPLKRELEDFVACARSGKEPKVTGEHGYAAVVLANQIHDQLLHATTGPALLRKSA